MPRSRTPRVVVALLILVPAIFAAPASAGTSTEITLKGTVPSTHTFALRCTGDLNPCASPETITIVCSPDDSGDSALCEATTYELPANGAVGETLDYALLRWTTPDLGADPEEHLAGSWTVQEGRQVISLTFDYSLGTDAPVLPDTAMPAP